MGAAGDATVEEYKGGEFHILVATNLTAPELQDKTFSHVINYDVPQNSEAYSQRVTRAGKLLLDMFVLVISGSN